MVIIGLTGSIGMGKSTVADHFKRLGFPVHDADAAVHDLLKSDKQVIAEIKKAFPSAVKNNTVDRAALGKAVFGNKQKLDILENILHPRVKEERVKFLERAQASGVRAVVLDIPLLFETGAEDECDVTVVVSAPADVQRQRVLSREGMSDEKFDAVMAHQMPDAEKRARADFVINTGLGHAEAFAQVRKIAEYVSTIKGRHWPPFSRP